MTRKASSPRSSIRDKQKLMTLGLLKSAARKIFYAKPFDEVSVDDIAAEAGVSRGTVYLHFSNKSDMLLDLLMDDLQGQREMYERLANVARADRPTIRKWLREFREDFDARRKSMELFPLIFRSAYHVHLIQEHRDKAIQLLGRRFTSFSLEGLSHAAAEQRRARAHMLIFQLELTVHYFSTSPDSPKIEVGLDILADRIVAFIEHAK